MYFFSLFSVFKHNQRRDWFPPLKINIFIAIAMENCAQQQARAPSKSDIPKWEQLPNWEIVIQTHLLQSMPPHLPRGTDKGPIYVIKSAEPKYIFCPPKNAPRRAQKCETVSGHLGNADYDVPTLFTLVYKCHQTRPTVS